MPTHPTIDAYAYPVQPSLGRHHVLDGRSLAYRRPYDGHRLRTAAWEPRIPVLDQRNLIAQGIHTSTMGLDTDIDALASCTGNAATTLLSVIAPDRATADGLDLADTAAAQRYAISLYADATRQDRWHTSCWPTDDCGSSGLGAAKALRARGLIDQYGHATTAEELCALLQTGPVLLGMPWYAAFSEPDGDGFIDNVAWSASPLEGGHEVCVTALERVPNWDGTVDYDHTILRFRNSWGPSWGDHGDARMRLSTYLALRDHCDVIQPRLDGVTP
ncbi:MULTISPECIES: hypothetical protein [Streptomyces]|uniref:Papain family cysteine protease n=1 Tax=Streptomyces fradiae ATCC 10745 = DSM 40063 TaxID=1319510 RepID=A0A1Y2NY84_STRFR|nr:MULTISPECIES: hypothetical protein [Streptomyces]KAF0646609.1 hypothetical protein K701_28070 [Streptomyces fradiae ATCC 10745 = DSM 40063]OSY52181.1 hypothetical protein BG846_02161 [Streptomyces fradiae ATCC 10745 = DSM 40063]